MCRRCFAGIWAADGMGSHDVRNAVGDLPTVYSALCCRSICGIDLGLAQRSTHEFEASWGHRRTCRRGVRRDCLRVSLPGRLRAVHRNLVRDVGWALWGDWRDTRPPASAVVIGVLAQRPVEILFV
jgi:hypothetical protein